MRVYNASIHTDWKGLAKVGLVYVLSVLLIYAILFYSSRMEEKKIIKEQKTVLAKPCCLGKGLVSTVKSEISSSSLLKLTRFPKRCCPSKFNLSSPLSSSASSLYLLKPKRGKQQDL